MGKLTRLQTSASPGASQHLDSFAQVLLVDEFMLLTWRATGEESLRQQHPTSAG